MKLYTHALSPFSGKVRVALDEKDVAYDEERLPISRQAILSKPKAMLDVNPRGQVPTLIAGELALYDSTVILEWLEERHPEPTLLPRDVDARARARLLEDEGDWLMNTAVMQLLAQTYRLSDPSPADPAELAAATTALRGAFDRLEAQLADGRAHLVGEDFGVADLSMHFPIAFAAFFGVPPTASHPRLADWLARVSARPSIAREMARMTEALAELPA
ncbi:MAG: glutathione S-transferase family protein [Myxococcota bacterium]